MRPRRSPARVGQGTSGALAEALKTRATAGVAMHDAAFVPAERAMSGAVKAMGGTNGVIAPLMKGSGRIGY
jgi:hypothetical protein